MCQYGSRNAELLGVALRFLLAQVLVCCYSVDLARCRVTNHDDHDDEPATRCLTASTIRLLCCPPLPARDQTSRQKAACQSNSVTQPSMRRAACCGVCSNCINSDREALRPRASAAAGDSSAARRSIGFHRSHAIPHAYTVADCATAFPAHDSYCECTAEKPRQFLVVLDRRACDHCAHSMNGTISMSASTQH